MIKAAFFDIDGTLLSYHTHRFTLATISTLRAMREKGILLFIASGRPTILFPNMPVVFDGYITMNGGNVYTHNNVLYSKSIDKNDATAWFNYADKENICTMCFSDNEMYVNTIREDVINIQHGLDMPLPPVMNTEDMAKRENYQIIGIMPPEHDDKVQRLMPHCRLPRWHDAFTDIVCADNSKATGMDVICTHFGISIAETMSFGDGGNDIEMLDHSGYAVVMGNAKDHVKAHADYVTLSVEDDGISHAIKELGII
ncbi:MAG: Cof-type HAD-IIB family hydrolase [Bacteroidales bacterium]|nr:Cof-type HAD-IIB family hydrolase [Bacteroidales bacterium]